MQGPAGKIGGLLMQPLETPPATQVTSDLAVRMAVIEGQLVGKWTFDTSIFKAEHMQRMCQHFVNLLDSIVNDPDQNLSDLRIISKAVWFPSLLL